MPPNYQNTKIYKIWSPNSEKVYVGATVQTLAQRMGKHRKPSNDTQSKLIIDLGDAKIELIEEFPCNNKMESDRKEGAYIRSLNCVNKQIAGRTMKEWSDEHENELKAKRKEYNLNNKELVAKIKHASYEKNKSYKLEQAKLYYEANKEKIAIASKKYYDKNKLEILEKKKAYYEANSEKIIEKEKARKDRAKAKAKLEKEQSLI